MWMKIILQELQLNHFLGGNDYFIVLSGEEIIQNYIIFDEIKNCGVIIKGYKFQSCVFYVLVV